MSNGIAHNNLNDISKIYLDTISDINKKEQEDDVKRWQQEEAGCETKPSPFKKKKYKEDWQPEIEHSKLGDAKKKADKKKESKLPPHLRGDAIDKMKKAFAHTNEGYSNWRSTLREVTSDAEAVEIDNQPEIKEKKVKNKIKINPEFKEAVKQMGGELLEVKEVDSPDGETKDDKKAEADELKKKKISDKERKLKMRILRVKMMATKQDAGGSIVAGYEPKVNAIKKLVNERLGGKGYSRKATKGGGDWPDSDRGAGNKATRRAGGEVKAKSPTYQAHVINKKKKKHNCASKVKHEEYGIGNCIKEMHTLDEDGNVSHYDIMFSNKIIKNVPSSSLEILEGHMHEHYVNEEKNKENFTPHKMIDPSTKKVYMANTYDEHMKYQKKGYVHEEKKSKKRNCGCGQDPCITYGKQEKVEEKVLDKFETGEKERIVKGMKKDTKGFKKRYGDKWKNVMYATATKKAKEAGDTSKSDKRYAVEGASWGLWKGDGKDKIRGDGGKTSMKDRPKKYPYGKATKENPRGKRDQAELDRAQAYIKKNPNFGKKKEVKEDKALAAVKASIIKKHGKGAIYDGKSKPKPPSEAEKKKAAAERKKRQDADNKAYAARAKKAGFKSTQDYTDVVARYGSEDNYRKGKGLGT